MAFSTGYRKPADNRVGNLLIPGVELGSIYLLRSSINCRFRGPIDLLHVISTYRGGEIRGYWRSVGSSGPWTVRTPNYVGAWPEIDAATAALVHGTIVSEEPTR